MTKRMLRIIILAVSLAGILGSQAQAAIVTSTFVGGGAGSIIPPFGTSGPLNVSANVGVSGVITDVNVFLSITHTWDADLDIRLISPSGTSVELTSDNGGSGDNYLNTIFDDEASTPITAGFPPFTDSYIPEQLLSAFDGENLLGLWILNIVDDTPGDTGKLLSWELEITYNDLSAIPLPAAFWLFGTALVGLIGFGKRRKSAC